MKQDTARHSRDYITDISNNIIFKFNGRNFLLWPSFYGIISKNLFERLFMKINIYYGGRGILDDPTLFVLNKMQEVFAELNVKVEKFNLYEQKNNIITLPASINDADGIILATTVEWFGIGGFMQQFLDACWLYGNKEKINSTYMCPIVMSTTFGERKAMTDLSLAWEILGGLPCNGLCGYVEDLVTFELNKDYTTIIEKTTENIYRTISQKTKSLPTSSQAGITISTPVSNIPLTPQESEQLSKYASDDSYVQRQKEDIEELTNYFKGKMENKGLDENSVFINDFKNNYIPNENLTTSYKFVFKDKKKPLIIEIKEGDLNVFYGNLDVDGVTCKLDSSVLSHIIAGQITFQRAFMSGSMQFKGDFTLLRNLDDLFKFN